MGAGSAAEGEKAFGGFGLAGALGDHHGFEAGGDGFEVMLAAAVGGGRGGELVEEFGEVFGGAFRAGGGGGPAFVDEFAVGIGEAVLGFVEVQGTALAEEEDFALPGAEPVAEAEADDAALGEAEGEGGGAAEVGEAVGFADGAAEGGVEGFGECAAADEFDESGEGVPGEHAEAADGVGFAAGGFGAGIVVGVPASGGEADGFDELVGLGAMAVGAGGGEARPYVEELSFWSEAIGEGAGLGDAEDGGADAEDADFLVEAGGEEVDADVAGAVEEEDPGGAFEHHLAEVVVGGDGGGCGEDFGEFAGEGDVTVGDADDFNGAGGGEGAEGVDPNPAGWFRGRRWRGGWP